LNELFEEYKEEGLVVLGVCTSKNGQENYASTVESTGMEYPVARDPDTKTIAPDTGWVVKWFPTYVIVDKKGVVRASGLFNDEGTEEIIKKLLAEEVAEGDDIGGEDAGGEEPMAGSVEIPEEFLEGRDDRESIQTMAGKPAPPLQVENWINSEPLDLKNLQGKVVMVDFWGTW
jgi:hypothetical protein